MSGGRRAGRIDWKDSGLVFISGKRLVLVRAVARKPHAFHIHLERIDPDILAEIP